MPSFNVLYRTRENPAVIRGAFESPTESLLRSDLQSRGWTVLLVQASTERTWKERLAAFNKLRVRMPRFGVSTAELALMCEIFRALYSSGVQMLQIVQMTLEETPNPWLKKKLIIVLEHLRVGDSLYVSMSDPRCRRAFPPLMRETIHTGEENGRLDQALSRLTNTFKRIADTKRETTSALMYPAFTLVAFVGVCTILAVMIPEALNEFIGKEQIAKFTTQLPFAIRTLFYLHDHPLTLILPPTIIVGIVVLCAILNKFRASRYALTVFARRIPLAGSLIEHFAIVRFLEVLTANHDSGIAIGDSLLLVRNSVGDAILESSIERVHDNILKNGYGISEAMSEEKELSVYPGLVRQMIRAGEESGRFSEMLRPIMDYYDEQARALLKRMLDLLTPIMIVVLGSIVGPIVLGVYKTITLMNDAMVGGFGG